MLVNKAVIPVPFFTSAGEGLYGFPAFDARLNVVMSVSATTEYQLVFPYMAAEKLANKCFQYMTHSALLHSQLKTRLGVQAFSVFSMPARMTFRA